MHEADQGFEHLRYGVLGEGVFRFCSTQNAPVSKLVGPFVRGRLHEFEQLSKRLFEFIGKGGRLRGKN